MEGLGFGGFGGFAGWQTAALKAHRKPLLWPWPWGACWGRCLEGLEGFVWRVWKVFGGFGRFWRVLAKGFEGRWRVWRVWRVLERFGAFAGWQTAALKAHRKPLLWPWPWGACWEGPWPWGVALALRVPAWRVWRVFGGFGGFGGFGRFWRVLEGLRAGKRQL